MRIRKTLKGIGFTCLAIVVVGFFMGFASRGIRTQFRNGGAVCVKPASFWGKLYPGECKVTYETSKAISGTVVFNDNWFNGPILVIPTDNDRVFLCLYRLCDMGLWVVKIDTTKRFEAFPSGSHLYEIIQRSPWRIEEGSLTDWEKMYSVFKGLAPETFKGQLVPTLDIGIIRLYPKKEYLMPYVKGMRGLKVNYD